ncbi:LysR family transcriptional regulator [uncultured Limosilactobacillus sp.]|uniref:LysR family transcriptional regulator n=1 Tax=uncultured Limosilactobacillus sp. TaxID=2837629 RepID=UPI0025D18938|nr:LysR family transcriptional regulator [uncultured Limosilactobacillus sp.]
MNRLRALQAILTTGSFTAAGQQLGYSQSAISQMINSLENEVGFPLLYRTHSQVELTPDGQKLLPLVEQLCNDWSTFQDRVAEIRGLQSATIKIGTISSISAHWLPPLIKNFQQRYPGVHFTLLQGDYTTIPQWVDNNTVDFGFINPAAQPHLPVKYLKSGELKVVLPVNHPLAKKQALSLTDLAKEPFLMLEEGLYSEPLNAFHQQGIQPNIQLRVHDDYSLLAMIEAGLGYSILADLVLTKQNYQVAIRPLTPRLYRQIGIYQRPTQLMSLASQRFIETLFHQVAQLP